MDPNKPADPTATPDTTPMPTQDVTPEPVIETTPQPTETTEPAPAPAAETETETGTTVSEPVVDAVPAVDGVTTEEAPVATDQDVAAAPSAEDPGKTLGIVGLILAILGFGPISLVISIVARNQSKKAGHANGLALAGIIISAITTVLVLLFILLTVLVAAS